MLFTYKKIEEYRFKENHIFSNHRHAKPPLSDLTQSHMKCLRLRKLLLRQVVEDKSQYKNHRTQVKKWAQAYTVWKVRQWL